MLDDVQIVLIGDHDLALCSIQRQPTIIRQGDAAIAGRGDRNQRIVKRSVVQEEAVRLKGEDLRLFGRSQPVLLIVHLHRANDGELAAGEDVMICQQQARRDQKAGAAGL